MRRSVRLLFFLLIAEPVLFAQDIAQNDFKKLTLEELMDVNVSSVTRKAEHLGQTAAAVTVLTSEDIRRSGATNIPEALRLVPGLQVARFNAGSWAITARGFNSTASNKLLVMIDGRTVYSPIFSGTFWELQDLILDDVERIEVVRGPGATLWGANAVNGVINVITKSAHQTKGTALRMTGGGADDLAIVSLRHGVALNSETSVRAFGKYYYRDQMKLADHSDAKDSTRFGRTGFRLDSSHGSDDFTVQGDAFRGLAGILGRADGKSLGGDILLRWSRKLSNTSGIQVQTYYDRLLRRVPLQSDFHQKTFDIDFQHQFQAAAHSVTWGTGFRWNRDETVPTIVLSFVPQNRTYPLETAFIQDEISFGQNRGKITVGSKFEHNDFTGFEIQPSVRASWAIRADQFVWGAVTRAVRTPTRFDSDIRFGPPALQFAGNPDFKSEDLAAIEFGYRTQAVRKLSLDVASYFNVYDNVRSLERQSSSQPGISTIAILNNLNAKTFGGEVAATYDARERLRFTAGYAYLGKRLSSDPGHLDFFGGTIEGDDPKHQFFVRGSADLPHRLEFDSALRFVSKLPAPPVPHYFELDARLGWTPTPTTEFSIRGHNILHAQHPEFGSPGATREEIERSVYGRIALRF